MTPIEQFETDYKNALPKDLETWTYSIPEEKLNEAVSILTNLPIDKDIQVIIDFDTDGCCSALIFAYMIDDVSDIKLISAKEVENNNEQLKNKFNIFMDINPNKVKSLLSEEDISSAVVIDHHETDIDTSCFKLYVSCMDTSTSMIMFDIAVKAFPETIPAEVKLYAISGALSDKNTVKGKMLQLYREVEYAKQYDPEFISFWNNSNPLKSIIPIEISFVPIFNKISRLLSKEDSMFLPAMVNNFLRVREQYTYKINDEGKTYNTKIKDIITSSNKTTNYYMKYIEKLKYEKIDCDTIRIYQLTERDVSQEDVDYDILCQFIGIMISRLCNENTDSPAILIMRQPDGSYRGTMRDYNNTNIFDIIMSFKDKGIITSDSGGHKSAAGFGISNIVNYKEFIHNIKSAKIELQDGDGNKELDLASEVIIPNTLSYKDYKKVVDKYGILPIRYSPKKLYPILLDSYTMSHSMAKMTIMRGMYIKLKIPENRNDYLNKRVYISWRNDGAIVKVERFIE